MLLASSVGYHTAMPDTQNFKNHARFDPPYHFFAVAILLANVIVAIVAAFHTWSDSPGNSIWRVLVAMALLMIAFKARSYALAAQDRVIRVEEKMRYAALLSPESLAKSASLNLRQMIALRFASDGELPALIARAVSENLAPKQIKESIQTWRPDNDRV